MSNMMPILLLSVYKNKTNIALNFAKTVGDQITDMSKVWKMAFIIDFKTLIAFYILAY